MERCVGGKLERAHQRYQVRAHKSDMNDEEQAIIESRIDALQLEHRDLDDVIAMLSDNPYTDQLQLRRMKARKLKMKDSISRLASMLIPDLNA